MRCGFFFFFQTEDGIRGIGVTGVQTCALPIYKSGGSVSPGLYIANLSVEMENGLFETKSIRIAITP